MSLTQESSSFMARRMSTGKESLKKLDLTSGGVSQALKILQEKDFVEMTACGYELIDPAVSFALRDHFPAV